MLRFVLVSLLISLTAGVCDARRCEHSEVIESGEHHYEIDVGGFRDPVNETIIIENLGDVPVINPRISVNGKYDWFDVESMAREATLGCSTEEEKAFAIFNFVRTQSQHLSPPKDLEALNPVVYFNVYGYGQCAFHAAVSVALSRAAGMKARVWEVWKHTVSEFWYKEAWHMLDSDIEAYYLMEDNRTIACIAQLWEDQKVTGGRAEDAYLTRFSGRTMGLHAVYTDVEGNIGWSFRDGTRSLGARYFHGDDFFYVQDFYDHYTYEPHTMAMTIRPNEKLVRKWKGGEKYYDYRSHIAEYARDPKPWRKPIRYGAGEIIWKPDLSSKSTRSSLSRGTYLGTYAEDGVKPFIHVKGGRKHGGVYDIPSRAAFGVKTPYSILGGKLSARVYRGGATAWDNVAISVLSRRGTERAKVWEAPKGIAGSMDVEVDLNEILYPAGLRARRDFEVLFELMANEKNDPTTETGLESIQLSTDIQCAPNSLPALTLGKNLVCYRDETPGRRKIKITHVWQETYDDRPPLPPERAVYPEDGQTIAELAPGFKWSVAQDLDREDYITDYYFTVSFDPECRWPISTSLLAPTGSDAAQWELPKGWLNEDTTYYWKVRAKDSKGIWGEWSKPFRFRTSTNAE